MDQLVKYSDKLKKFLSDYYLKKGKAGILQVVGIAALFYIAQYQIRRNNGWLCKKNVHQQHVFITGGGMGLGKQMALRFLSKGAKVTIADINQDALNQTTTEFNKKGFQHIYSIQCDVTSFQSVENAVKLAVQKNGDVDILINNAGIVSGKNILDNSPQAIEKTIAVNTTSHFWTTKCILPRMIERNSGHIVTIASIAGWVGVNRLADYCASKFGAVGFDESLRFEMRDRKKNIKTTCICPYYINTGMFDGVKSKFPLLLPILSEDYATTRIMNGILQEEKVVIMPFTCQLTVLFKAILPVCMYDRLCEFFGTSDSMSQFKGRQQQL